MKISFPLFSGKRLGTNVSYRSFLFVWRTVHQGWFCFFYHVRISHEIVTTRLKYHCLKCPFTQTIAILSKHYKMLSPLLSFSIWKRHLGHWYVKYVVTIPRGHLKSWNIIKKIMYFLVNLKRRSWDFKPLLKKAKPTSLDSSSDKPKALIRNVASQPFHWNF